MDAASTQNLSVYLRYGTGRAFWSSSSRRLSNWKGKVARLNSSYYLLLKS